MFIPKQSFLILGMGRSGRSVAEYVLKKGGKCYIYEELSSPKTEENIKKLVDCGAIRVGEEFIEDTLRQVDALVISPGVPINHSVAVLAKKLGVRILGELEFGYLLFSPLICAVTGTNGKTTTVSLIEHILKSAEVEARAVGNIGTPLTSEADDIKKNEILVAEVSSFQLESVNSFRPHIAMITNISPDHLERHYTFDNYVFLKKRLFKNQTSSEYTVLNFDDKTVRLFAEETKGKKVWISCEKEVNGAYEKEGKLYFNGEYIIEESDLTISGKHNVFNALFAIAACKILGIDGEKIRNGLKTFKGVKHRMELICTKNGVAYYNDSKSTNTGSAISAIKSMKSPVVLILGGSEKGEKYDKFFEEIKRYPVRQIILTGASRFNMMDAAGRCGVANITLTGNYELSIKIAALFAEEGDSVLFSPACASFDNFSGYEERGDFFRKIVGDIS